jgi:hypothetical protein
MSAIQRSIQINIHGYQEVNLDYRIARSKRLEAAHVDEKTGRIVCPMVDACRSKSAYGQMALAVTDKKHLNHWAKALGVNPLLVRIIAYLSGPLAKFIGNMLSGRFNDKAINTGFIRGLKHGVNTGMLTQTFFSQVALNHFVWSFCPELTGTEITQQWLYSEKEATLYLDQRAIPNVIAYNITNAEKGRFLTWIGSKISTFEITKLLVGVLAQDIILDQTKPEQTVKAILVRDIFDLYKYGWMPASVEEKLVTAGLLNIDVL